MIDDNDSAAAAAAGLSAAEQAALTAYHSETNFLALHRPQLESMQLPKALWPRVYHKIYTEQFDLTDAFVVAREEGDERRMMVAERDVQAKSDVWVIDHAWTTNTQRALNDLITIDGLTERLEAMIDSRGQGEQDQVPVHEEAKNLTDATEASEDAANASGADESDADPRWANDETITVVSTQAACDAATALAALMQSHGSVVDAIQLASEWQARAQTSVQSSSAPSALSAPAPSPPESVAVSRAERVWRALFATGLVHDYYTTKPRESGTGPLNPRDVERVLFVEDETGSAMREADTSSEANVHKATLVCVTLNGAAFTVAWPTKDIEEGDEAKAQPRKRLHAPDLAASAATDADTT